MDLIKKHYEKIVLGGVLLILVVSAAMLPVMISNERDGLQRQADEIIRKPAKPLEPLNTTTQQLHLTHLQSSGVPLDLSSSNKVLNPLLWQKAADGRLIKIQTGEETGPKALVVTKQTPLYLTISLDNVSVTEGAPRYTINVEREAATQASKRGKKPFFTTLNKKEEVFVVREAKGPADSPTELILELVDGGEMVSLLKEKQYKYQRVDGYMVDLKYPFENRPPWINQRVGNSLRIGSEDYIIVAITKTEVVVLAKSNQKKTPVPVPQQ